MKLILYISFMLWFSSAYAGFGTIPIHHEGRIKPMAVFAQSIFDGTLHEKNALDQIQNAIKDPESFKKHTVFKIEERELKELFNLPPQQNKFSIQDMKRAIETTRPVLNLLLAQDRDLTQRESDFIKLHSQFWQINQILNSFGYVHSGFQEVLRDPGDEDADRLSALRSIGENSKLFKIIPTATGWVTPWQVIIEGKGSPQTTPLMTSWESYIFSKDNNDTEDIKKAYEPLYQISPLLFTAEILYSTWPIYTLLIILYIGLVVLPARLLLPAQIGVVGCHGLALLIRIGILDRPPVSNLYESVLFISLLCGVFGIIASGLRHKENFKTARILTLIAAGLLCISLPLKPETGSLAVLDAVLNTKFWLGTHVMIITLGYALCLLTSAVAHLKLFQRKTEPQDISQIMSLSIISLLVVTIGTVLGGLWADLSWGRFWGWDPKENGALLIILWLIWITHGRVAGHFSNINFLALTSGLGMIVALSWFGVNLLNTGLHSYGFIDGVGFGLLGFIIINTTLILGMVHRCKTSKV